MFAVGEPMTLTKPLGRALSTERSLGVSRAAPLWLVALALAMFLPGFFGLQPMDRDEPRFAQATKQMLESGDFVAIRFQNEARNKKPAGIYWLQAVAVGAAKALGFPNAFKTIWLYRLPSLLGAVATVLLTYWAGLAFLSWRAAALAGALTASTVLLGVEARLATTDAVLASSVVAAMGALGRIYLAQTDPARREDKIPVQLPVLFWTAIALGVLVKGPITPMVAALAATTLSVKERSGRWLKPLRPALGLVWVALLVVPWFALIMIRTHGAFLIDSVGGDMLAKVASAKERHGAPPGAYFLAFWITAWPMAPFAALAAPCVWRRRREPAVAFLLAWIVPAWLLFEAVPTKLPHYVLPLYPAIALAVAFALDRRELAFERRWARPILMLLPLVALLFVAVGTGLAVWQKLMPGWAAWLAAPLVLWQALRLARPIGADKAILAVAHANILAWLVFFGVYQGLLTGPFTDPISLSPRLAQALVRARAASLCPELKTATTSYREPSLVFLVGTALRLTDPEGAAAFLAKSPCRAALVEERERPIFEAALPSKMKVRLFQQIRGFNLNRGQWLDLDVWVRPGVRP